MNRSMNTTHIVLSLVGGLAFAAGTASAAALYSNGSTINPSDPGLSTGATALNGAIAPVGFVWSECPADGTGAANAIAGLSCHLTGTTGAYRFADDFTVSGTNGWRIDTIAVFAYQTGVSGGGPAPFTAVNLRIWSGRPGDPGSTVVFGDTTTNRLSSSTATNVLRVFNSVAQPAPVAPDSSRVLWQTTANVGTTLAPGTYWLDWQITSAAPSGEAFVPPVTVFGARSKVGANGRQFKTAGGGQWVDASDTGKPVQSADVVQDFPFLVAGAIVPACPGDADGDGSIGLGDIALMIQNWSFTVTPGTNGDTDGDGVVGLGDLALAIKNWDTACP